VLVTKGEPLDVHNKELVHTWSENIPLVAEILKQQDALGSLKPLIYTLVAPKDRNDLQLREQLTLLWSADPADKTAIGHTGFGPPMQLAGQLSDVQYRDLMADPIATVRALVDGTVTAADIFSTSPAIRENNLVVLEDPKNNFLAANVVPLVSSQKKSDELKTVLDAVSAKLTTDDLIELNTVTSGNAGVDADEAAKKWVQDNGFDKPIQAR
jgi:hypothetical protein